MKRKTRATLLWLWFCVTVTLAHGSMAQTLNVERLRVCAALSDAQARLACYDQELAGLARDATATSADAKPSPAQNNQASTVPEAEFGVQGSEVARRRVDQVRKEASPVKSISSAVTSIDKELRGELVITLENGQVWREKTGQPYFPLRVGDKVTISAGTLGSFRMFNATGRSTPVTRVK